MSATNRGAVRVEDDFYETPAWCVRRLLDYLVAEPKKMPSGLWLDAGAGSGAIVRAARAWGLRGPAVSWAAVEKNERRRAPLLNAVSTGTVEFCDFLAYRGNASAVIMNPPYSLAIEFVEKALSVAPVVYALTRLNFLAGGKRSAFMRQRTPSVLVLPNRPSFTADGRTDATEYAWLAWDGEEPRVAILADTPRSERVKLTLLSAAPAPQRSKRSEAHAGR